MPCAHSMNFKKCAFTMLPCRPGSWMYSCCTNFAIRALAAATLDVSCGIRPRPRSFLILAYGRSGGRRFCDVVIGWMKGRVIRLWIASPSSWLTRFCDVVIGWMKGCVKRVISFIRLCLWIASPSSWLPRASHLRKAKWEGLVQGGEFGDDWATVYKNSVKIIIVLGEDGGWISDQNMKIQTKNNEISLI